MLAARQACEHRKANGIAKHQRVHIVQPPIQSITKVNYMSSDSLLTLALVGVGPSFSSCESRDRLKSWAAGPSCVIGYYLVFVDDPRPRKAAVLRLRRARAACFLYWRLLPPPLTMPCSILHQNYWQFYLLLQCQYSPTPLFARNWEWILTSSPYLVGYSPRLSSACSASLC